MAELARSPYVGPRFCHFVTFRFPPFPAVGPRAMPDWAGILVFASLIPPLCFVAGGLNFKQTNNQLVEQPISYTWDNFCRPNSLPFSADSVTRAGTMFAHDHENSSKPALSVCYWTCAPSTSTAIIASSPTTPSSSFGKKLNKRRTSISIFLIRFGKSANLKSKALRDFGKMWIARSSLSGAPGLCADHEGRYVHHCLHLPVWIYHP